MSSSKPRLWLLALQLCGHLKHKDLTPEQSANNTNNRQIHFQSSISFINYIQLKYVLLLQVDIIGRQEPQIYQLLQYTALALYPIVGQTSNAYILHWNAEKFKLPCIINCLPTNNKETDIYSSLAVIYVCLIYFLPALRAKKDILRDVRTSIYSQCDRLQLAKTVHPSALKVFFQIVAVFLIHPLPRLLSKLVPKP